IQSYLGMYATDCTQTADSLYTQAGLYVKEIRNTQNPDEQKTLERKALNDYQAAFDEVASLACEEKLFSLAHADFAYKLATRAINLEFQDKAIPLYQIALKIRKDSLAPGHPNIVKCYTNLSMAHRQLIRLKESAEIIELGFEELNQPKDSMSNTDKFFKAYHYHEAAQLHIDQGDPYGALGLNEIAYNLFGEIGKFRRQISSGNQRGVIFEQLGEHEEGIAHMKEVEGLSLDKANGYWINKIQLNLGNLFYRKREHPKAIAYFQKAVNSSQSDIFRLGTCYENIALINFLDGKYEEAIKNYSKAIEVHKSIESSGKGRLYQSNNLTGLADVYRAQKQFDKSFGLYQKALALMIEAYEEEDYYKIPKLDKLASQAANRFLIETINEKAAALFEKFIYEQDQKALNASREHYLLAINIIDELRTNFQDKQSKLVLMKNVYKTYEGAIEVAYYQNNPGLAFQLAEKAKATLLYASMLDKEAKSFADIPEEALAAEQDLKRSIAILEQKKEGLDEDSEAYKESLDELILKKRELQEMIASFGKKYPEYYRLKYDTDLVDVAEIQAQLADSSLMIEYFAGEKSYFIFALGKERIQLKKIEPLASEIREFASLLPQTENWSSKISKEEKELFNCLAHQLYEELIGDFWGKEGQKYAIIIPDKEIYYLPLDVLLTEQVTSEMPLSQYPFLLRSMAASYDFSAKLWLRGSKNKSNAGWFQKGLLAFAPDFHPLKTQDLAEDEQEALNLDFFQARSTMDENEQLVPLHASKDEVHSIQGLMGGEVYGEDQQKGLLGYFLQKAPNYRFIHLGTHGIFNKYNSKYSYLAFQPVEDGIDNERLYLSDLYNLNLDAEMVVLSACETQVGELLPGEGIASLAQGFTYAGAKSIVATLWSVQNASNAELMKRFYQNLIEGENKASALQKAKISMNEEGLSYGPPFYWAAPTIIGSNQAINPPSAWQRFFLIGFSLLLFVSISFIFLKRNKN
ncbi:MAG: CHAT domain-containing tetratricopeptide repeat protein, partial [Bacteroidota bacterium]